MLKGIQSYYALQGTLLNPLANWQDTNFVFEGHSFMLYGTSVLAIAKNSAYYDSHVSGSTIADISNRAAVVDSKLVTETTTKKNILILWAGVNDVFNTAGQGLTAYNLLKTYVQNRADAGWYVFVYTMTPSTYGGRSVQFEIERNIFNDLLRNDLSNFSRIYIVNADSRIELNDPSNFMYYIDLLHPTSLGYNILIELLAEKFYLVSKKILRTLSEEMLTNIEFETTYSPWVKDAYWTHTPGYMTYLDTTNGLLRQAVASMGISLEPNQYYKIVLEIDLPSNNDYAKLIVIPYSWTFDYITEGSYFNAVNTIYFKTPADIGSNGIGLYAKNTGSAAFNLNSISLKKCI